MKKFYLSKYLYNFNTDAGAGEAAGGGAGSGQAADTSGAPDAGATGAGNASGTESAKDWFSTLPEDIRNHEKLKGVKTGEEFVKAVLSTAKEGAVPEKYALPEGAPQEIADWAKSEKLSQAQLDNIIKKHAEITDTQFKSRIEAQKAGAVELFKSWGAEKEANLQLANRVLAMSDPDGKLGVAKYMQSPESAYAMMNPIIIRMFHNIGLALKESGFIKGDFVPANQNNGVKVNPAHEMYPGQVPKN